MSLGLNCKIKKVYWEKALDFLPDQKVGGREDRLPDPDLPFPFKPIKAVEPRTGQIHF